MPEVVYTNDGRDWDDVIPSVATDNEDSEVVNAILLAIAMNNRFGGKTTTYLRKALIDGAKENSEKYLAKPERNQVQRDACFAQLGRYLFFVDKVFDNLGGAFRERK